MTLTKKANAEELAAFKCSEGLLGIVLEVGACARAYVVGCCVHVSGGGATDGRTGWLAGWLASFILPPHPKPNPQPNPPPNTTQVTFRVFPQRLVRLGLTIMDTKEMVKKISTDILVGERTAFILVQPELSFIETREPAPEGAKESSQFVSVYVCLSLYFWGAYRDMYVYRERGVGSGFINRRLAPE